MTVLPSKISVAIIGAGIAGLHLSKLLDKEGISHVVLEKNSFIGKYGNRIINKDVFRKLELTHEEVIRPIQEIAFYSPSEIELHKKDEEKRGYVTNIELIENRLYEIVNNKDAIKLNHFVTDIDLERGLIKTNGNKMVADIIILASGIIQGKLASNLGLKPPRLVFCFTNEMVGNDIITTILDNQLAHGFYGWVMPLQENVIEIGFGTDRISEIKDSNLEKRLFSLPYIRHFKKSKKLKIGGGFIPSSIIEKPCGKNWILIGDASGGEPMMGGSIHKCIDEAEIAAKTIEMHFNGEVNSLEEFNNTWNEKLGQNLKEQENMRNILDNVKNDEIDNAFQRLKNKPIEGDGLINTLFMNIMKNLIKKEQKHVTW